jgi:hypothetical protein
MGRFSMFMSVAFLAAAASITITPMQCVRQPPAGSPPGTIMYQTLVGDTPWSVAKRLYEDGSQEYIIRNANRTLLNSNGMFPTGTWIAVPPDMKGKAVDLTRFREKPY